MIDSILPFLFAHFVLLIGLRYTQPASPLRYFLQAIIFVCCFVSVRSTFALGIPGQVGGQYIFGMMMSSSHWMLLAGASAVTNASPGREWIWAVEMLFSARWGVSPKMLPPFRRNDRAYVPTRDWFLVTRSWDLIWTASAIYLINSYTLILYQSDFTMVPDGFLHRLPSVTPAEWAIRIYVTLLGKGKVYLTLRAGHSLVSIVAVAIGDSPERYPPLFGSFKEAYRVRRFYVYFWHHLIRKVFTTHSSLVVNGIFRVPSQTQTSRYMVLAFSFLMSAGMHIFVAPNVPLRCSAWPQLRYYLSIAGAIIIEDMATLLYRQFGRKIAKQARSNDNLICKIAGPALKVDKATATETTISMDDSATQRKKLQQRGGIPVRSKAETAGLAETTVTSEVKEGAQPNGKAFRALGYLWVMFFEVWSTSKFLYLTRQCLAK